MDDSSSCFETARTFQNILLATASTLNLRTRIESKGMRYRIDDFLVILYVKKQAVVFFIKDMFNYYYC